MNWTPIPKNRLGNITDDIRPDSWKLGTVYCYDSNRNCLGCDNLKYTNGWEEGSCMIPVFISKLLAKGIYPPPGKKHNGGFTIAK